MLRTVPRVLVTIGFVGAVVLTAGCGGEVDKAQACSDIKQELRTLSQAAAQQVGDPQALAKTLRDSAAKIRDHGEPVGDAVQQATADGSAALQNLAARVTDAPAEQPDLTPLIAAGEQLRTACTAA